MQLAEIPLFLDPATHQPVSAPTVREQSVGQRVEVGEKVYRIEGLHENDKSRGILCQREPHRAYGSSRAIFGLTGVAPAPPPVGLCESSVIVHGYKCQEFQVKTEDGYVLSIQRISGGRAGGGGKNKQPVLLQHGVLVDGMTWVLNSPNESLAFILADNDLDDYWNWSWDELVAYDLPATFDFVYRQTGQKMDYVGHSLGTLIALASFSEGKLMDQLRSAALLSPIAYLNHMTTALGTVAAKAFVGEITTLLGFAEFNPEGELVAKFLKSLCSNPWIDCYDLLTSFTAVRDGIVTKYDYGNANSNMEYYGQSKPPIYNLSNIPHNLPLFISYGGQDALSDAQDVELLLDSLKFHDGDKLTVQFIKDYAHADFIMGVSAKEIVYNAMLSFFKRQ
ncbi:hypothetical protein HHK36_025147 [Tetracentron sinense]|uniref:Partial AB-hydrolase lipase domain-containing protein n=1 Tax=Tetracentron sinense TaxID=13715 RepID=A0A834YM47_TETSI|nr:hypothetical protein HHK36_025147 [Tetracentron sinense]